MKQLLSFIIFSLIIQSNFAQKNNVYKKMWHYPFIKSDTVSDYYYGKRVPDSYRVLEGLDQENIKVWLQSQNKLYDLVVGNITYRDTLNLEMRKLNQKKKYRTSYAKIADKYVFYFTIFKDEKIERLVYIDSLIKTPIEIFNTSLFNNRDSCIYSIDYFEPSADGKYLAFGISPNGNEMTDTYIIDVQKGQLLTEKKITGIGGMQWLPDGSGFFYTKYDYTDINNPYRYPNVYFHKLFNSNKIDNEVFSKLLNKNFNLKEDDFPNLFVYPSSEKVLLNILNESYCGIYYATLDEVLNKPAESVGWNKICGVEEKMAHNVLYGNRFIGLSYKQNPNGQLIALNLPDLTPIVIYDAKDFTLDELVLTKNNIYITSFDKGSNKLVKVDPNNFSIENIQLPFPGGVKLMPTFSIISFYQPSNKLIFTLTGYNKQWCEYICDENNNVLNTNIIPEIQYTETPLPLTVEEIEVPSHDGVMVPLSIIYKKGLHLDANNPLILDAYGAYGFIKRPEFSPNRLVWFNHGGIYAVAHVRGGGEKGDSWYKGGLKATKPNSWKDLIACAEYLISQKYTSPEKLSVTGFSAGAVTVGKAITERPDLFKAAVIYVGTFNPLRMENSFNNVTISEFGTVKDSLEFQYLYNMDPYLHIKDGVKYPSVLFTASLNDTRVPAWQPAKGVAKMQEVSKGDNLILFRVEDKGHFDYPSDADVYSFLFWQLGHPDFKLKNTGNVFNPVK